MAILKGPWALQHGPWTIKLCREREVSFLIHTQASRYRDPRTFAVDTFTATPYAPLRPLAVCDRSAPNDFVEADLKNSGVARRLRPPSARRDPERSPRWHQRRYRFSTPTLLEIAQEKLSEARP